MLNAIKLETKHLSIVKQVKNFSKKNVIKAIADILELKENEIEQLVANTNGGIFGNKVWTSHTLEILPDTQPIKDIRYIKTYSVEYCILETK